MIDNLKWYLVQIGLRKYVPMAIMAAIAAVGTYLAAHAGLLEQYGVTYGIWPLAWPTPPSGPVIVLELDTLGAKGIAAISALAAVAIRAAQHHTTSDGSPLAGGRREDDPPAPPSITQKTV